MMGAFYKNGLHAARRTERNDRMKRRTDLAPLPRRVAPRPWEDIASFLSRTASAMGYSDPRWLLHPQEVSGFSITESDLPYLSRKDDYLVLERLLQLNEEALYQMTLHRFASVLQLPHHGPGENPSCIDRPLLDRRPRVSRSPYVRICPLCLSEPDGYDRVFWRIPSIMSCPEHYVILHLHCPQCHQPIRALRRDAYRCSSCHTGDYRCLAVSFLSDKHPLFQEELLLVKALGIPSTAPPDVPVELSLASAALEACRLLIPLHTDIFLSAAL